MSDCDFISGFGPSIEAMLDYREALGFSRKAHHAHLTHFDRYCAAYAPGESTVSKDMVLGWLREELEKSRPNINQKATAVRLLGRYLQAIGQDAYVLPDDFVSQKREAFTPYIFTDAELEALFDAADNLYQPGNDGSAFVAPVLFRLIYTCGLRPNEGRELERANINLDTGVIHITKTKRNKERLMVMSGDMLALCRKYDKRREVFCGGSAFFFPDQDGEAYTEQRLDRLFKRCWELANGAIAPDELPVIRLYDLRHRFASAILNRWLDDGRDLNVYLPYLRAYMGHKHMSETAYYIHILPENLVKSSGIDWEAFEDMIPSPLARQTRLEGREGARL